MEAIQEWLIEYPHLKNRPLSEWVTIIHGGCPSGGDRLADIFGRRTLNCKVIVYPADWRKYGRRAGPVRNLQMVQKSNADVCLAFIKDRSKGATGCRDLANKYGIPTETFYYEQECEKWPVPQVDTDQPL